MDPDKDLHMELHMELDLDLGAHKELHMELIQAGKGLYGKDQEEEHEGQDNEVEEEDDRPVGGV